MDILPTGQKNPYSGGGPYVSLLRQAYAKAYPNLPIPTESLEQSLRTGSRPFIDAEGKIYFLTENKEQTASLMATERESARRAKRPVQPFTPSYSYKTASGERFSGTFMGEGGYGGFGRFATDEQGNRVSKYSPQIMARRAAKGKDPYAAESTGILEPAGRGLGPVLPRSQRERQEMARMEAQAEATRRELAPETQPTAEATTYTPKPAPSAIFGGSGYGYTRTPLGYTGSELSFTPEGRRIGAGPQPTNLTTPVPTGMLDPNIFKRNLTGFGGVPMFPFSNY